MDLKKLFRVVSSKLYHDFIVSAEINHQGNKGSYRESALKEFLQNGRLPQRYGIGSGEIVGPARNVSKQCELIISDRLDGLSLLMSETVQVYPIESVFGVIEVKSQLSKEKLIEGLENIKSVKALAPNEAVIHRGPVFVTNRPRPKPFGMVFAYDLGDNSIDSLTANLREWEASVPAEFWPNLIAVLNKGVIFHYGSGLSRPIANADISQECHPGGLQYGEDTLFHFYLALLDLCTGTHLGPPQLLRYFDPAEKVGNYIVRHHDRLVDIRNPDDQSVRKLKLSFIEKVVNWCKARNKLTEREWLIRQFGVVPQGTNADALDSLVHAYDPDNLPGLHQVANPIVKTASGGAEPRIPMLIPSQWIEVDGEVFYIPWVYVTQADYEIMTGITRGDL